MLRRQSHQTGLWVAGRSEPARPASSCSPRAHRRPAAPWNQLLGPGPARVFPSNSPLFKRRRSGFTKGGLTQLVCVEGGGKVDHGELRIANSLSRRWSRRWRGVVFTHWLGEQPDLLNGAQALERDTRAGDDDPHAVRRRDPLPGGGGPAPRGAGWKETRPSATVSAHLAALAPRDPGIPLEIW